MLMHEDQIHSSDHERTTNSNTDADKPHMALLQANFETALARGRESGPLEPSYEGENNFSPPADLDPAMFLVSPLRDGGPTPVPYSHRMLSPTAGIERKTKDSSECGLRAAVQRLSSYLRPTTKAGPSGPTDLMGISPQANPDDFPINCKFEARLQKYLNPRVIYRDPKDDSITLNFATLHQAELHRLRKSLIEAAIDFAYGKHSEDDPFPTLGLIHAYRKALEDWDYIKSCALKGKENDPFIATSKEYQDCVYIWHACAEFRGEMDQHDQSRLLGPVGPDSPSTHSNPSILGAALQSLPAPTPHELQIFCKFDTASRTRDTQDLWGASRNKGNERATKRALFQRIGMAFMGGAFLIGPMLVMVLHPSQLTALLTTSLCVFAFGLIMALYLDDPFNVLSATAAYAAVLVVFIGSNGTG
ncbi:uncharacterized protein Z520_04262 [Fonsecaea multimorphosa CBS 102226]|uniref:DUF6594 domain-containing protein n=1 Tax=Fonsecaea multimorphosa CBS 102226 TaxID=1442371 RepID=A0A0D2KSD8_9EURO|nr:uncharacterized protein Z520_04262 [Fonsecaea multimorphosa CBS 102226]KIX99628.1 hypothetical protein Z520_04262 [Fonsecaea multimorphosa CBS 102226]OAL26681.1 hypothetical protein AYO22_04034 [Fonsecaea multimorphosa]